MKSQLIAKYANLNNCDEFLVHKRYENCLGFFILIYFL